MFCAYTHRLWESFSCKQKSHCFYRTNRQKSYPFGLALPEFTSFKTGTPNNQCSLIILVFFIHPLWLTHRNEKSARNSPRDGECSRAWSTMYTRCPRWFVPAGDSFPKWVRLGRFYWCVGRFGYQEQVFQPLENGFNLRLNWYIKLTPGHVQAQTA